MSSASFSVYSPAIETYGEVGGAYPAQYYYNEYAAYDHQKQQHLLDAFASRMSLNDHCEDDKPFSQSGDEDKIDANFIEKEILGAFEMCYHMYTTSKSDRDEESWVTFQVGEYGIDVLYDVNPTKDQQVFIFRYADIEGDEQACESASTLAELIHIMDITFQNDVDFCKGPSPFRHDDDDDLSDEMDEE